MAKVQKNTDGSVTVTFSDGLIVEFSKPNETHLGLALAAMRKDPFGMADVLVDNCLKAEYQGFKDDLKGEIAYCKQITEVLDDVFGKKPCDFIWEKKTDGDIALFSFEDGTSFFLRKCDRATYAESKAKSVQNPIKGIKYILKQCVLPDDGLDPKTFEEPGILLGFSEKVEDFLEYTGRALGN
jgi:hypothetical protein